MSYGRSLMGLGLSAAVFFSSSFSFALKPSDFFCLPDSRLNNHVTPNTSLPNGSAQALAFSTGIKDCGDKTIQMKNICSVTAKCVHLPSVKGELEGLAHHFGKTYKTLTAQEKVDFLTISSSIEEERAAPVLAQVQAYKMQLLTKQQSLSLMVQSGSPEPWTTQLRTDIAHLNTQVFQKQTEFDAIIDNKYAGLRTEMICEGERDANGLVNCPAPEECKGDILHKAEYAVQLEPRNPEAFQPTDSAPRKGSRSGQGR